MLNNVSAETGPAQSDRPLHSRLGYDTAGLPGPCGFNEAAIN